MARKKPVTAVLQQEDMRIDMVPLAQLITWPGNPKAHDSQTLGESFERFGYIDPVIVDEASGKIVAGHGRREKLLALKQGGSAPPGRVRVRGDGEWLIPVLRGIRFANEREAEAYLLTSNQSVIAPGWNEVELAEMLGRHTDNIAGMGWGQDEIDEIMARAKELEVDVPEGPDGAPLVQLEEDEAPPLPKDPITKPGDVWVLGDHRLICGDASKGDVVARILGSQTPFMLVTDPPYGVEYTPEWRKISGLNNSTRMNTVTGDQQSSWRTAIAFFKGDVAYVWCASLQAPVVAADLDALEFVRRSLIIWRKPALVISRGHYHWQHEPCWYAVRKGATARWCGDRSQSTIWEIARKDATGDTEHSTQKPVGCMGRPIRNHGREGDFVYDPFLGSGTTIVAAEQLHRRCIAIEIEPGWVDVTVERWQNLTGKKARRTVGKSRTNGAAKINGAKH